LDYQSALQYLYSLTDYEKERIARYDPDTLDLSRVRRVFSRLGNPQQRFRSIHIAGTKGKGSVAATCASVLQTAGLRTGLYTSPHLHTFRERIQIDGELISSDSLIELVWEYRPFFESEPELTTFEAITILAFTYFAQRRVDFGVIEVGLGGRLDATNVITPEVAVITSLSYDHTYLLGDTLAEIAREKAGIVKPAVPTVCAPQPAEALTVIEEICAERGAPLTVVGRDWLLRQLPHGTADETSLAERDGFPQGLPSQTFELRRAEGTSYLEGVYTTPLLGRHQVDNAAVAIAALDLLEQGDTLLHAEDVRQGVAKVRWPGRFEILRQDPALIVDCAHNQDSAAKLAAALEEWFPGRRWTFIVGASTDKDISGILQALAPRADRILATQSHHARAMPPREIADVATAVLAETGTSSVQVEVTRDVANALEQVLSGGEANHAPPLCVTGSIFVVAEAREFWMSYSDGQLPEMDVFEDPIMLPPEHHPERGDGSASSRASSAIPATVTWPHDTTEA
jgi:dihydrofolate synthase/folylpolyglutamate synthase